ncbi:hypothetical protein M5689_011480 [Euphorbia peplus]|nr:hypothetical protein M5689_011480 [Euphorbia peplus]
MGSSRNTILVVMALSVWIMFSSIPQGEAQTFTTPLSCFISINNDPGCKNAFTQTVFRNNATGLTPDCCNLVNGISKICSFLLFPFHPEAITILKSMCALVKSPPPSPSTAAPSPKTSTGPSPPVAAPPA